MILDILARLADAQAFTAADEKTTDKYDAGNPAVKRRIGTGTRLSVMFVITTAAAASGGSFSASAEFRALEDTVADLSTATTIISRLIPGASLPVGTIVELPLPVGTPTKRFLGGQVVLGVGDTLSADAFIVPSDHVQAFLAYAKNYAV